MSKHIPEYYCMYNANIPKVFVSCLATWYFPLGFRALAGSRVGTLQTGWKSTPFLLIKTPHFFLNSQYGVERGPSGSEISVYGVRGNNV